MSPLRILAAFAALLLAPAAAFAQVSPSPYTSGTRYDAAGRVTGTIAPDPDGAGPLNFAAVRNTYDGAGRLTKVETGELAAWQSEAVAAENWANFTTFTIFRTLETTYDGRSRKIQDTLREGASGTIRAVTQYSYDVLGRVECTAVRMNPAVFGSLPASACSLGTAGSDGPDRITRNVYDAAGQRLQLREAVGTSDEGTEATWAYSPNGKVTTVIDGNGNRAELHYDGYDRQDRWTFPSATRPASFNDATPATALASAGSVNAGDYEEYSYDANGNRTNLRKRDGRNIAFAYDALNRVTAKTYPQGGATPVYYSYDLRSLQLSARFDSQSGIGVTNSYDGFGRLASSSTSMGGTTRTLSYQYDANGNRTRITQPDGTWFDTSYDGLDRPASIRLNGWSAVTIAAYTPFGGRGALYYPATTSYTVYDGVQQPSAIVTGFVVGAVQVAWSYGRNPAGQVTSVARDNDAFAWAGHYAVNRAYTTNGLNQYSTAGSASFSYDPNGNLVSDGSRTWAYDIENRLVSSSTGAALTYDPLGRLFQVTGGGNTTRFLYDGDALVAEYDGSGAMTHRYAHWVGADVPVVSYDGAGLSAPHFLSADHQGSIAAVADTSGNILSINTYDEYGIPGAANQGRFQYTGQAWLSELGMYYYKARIYSPTLGRFMQTDPIGYADQFNLYEYVGDDPVNRTDPTGMWDPQAHAQIFALAIGRDVTANEWELILSTSIKQDLPAWLGGNGAHNEQHYLRNPGQDPDQARLATLRYIDQQIRLGQRLVAAGDRNGAIQAATRGAHASQDSFSPVHRDQQGKPAVYDPSWSTLEGVRHGHSPAEGVGREDSQALANSGRAQPAADKTRQIFERILGPDLGRRRDPF